MKVRLLPGNVDPTEALSTCGTSATGRQGHWLTGMSARQKRAQGVRFRRNLRAGRPYRKGKQAYREIHKRLAKAIELDHEITLRFVRNVSPTENINDVEWRCRDEHALTLRELDQPREPR
jgi:hypothetical protein